MHDAQNRIVRTWAGKAWLSCVLNPPFAQTRSPFTEGTYSELFFLDEATAFAAGHRPCRSCQRARYDAFKAGWTAANTAPSTLADVPIWLPIAQIDAALHIERVGPDRAKRTHRAPLAELPDGTVYGHEGQARLAWGGQSQRWSFEGYHRADAPPINSEEEVLTPPSIVALYRAGF